ncbi:integration host factor subunit alpha [Buchnera aphidicola]|uniref:integration host factor subunit alpha n=1 Tax=Buchnera aphidicola TaxID=9 RepID=UPI003463F79B
MVLTKSKILENLFEKLQLTKNDIKKCLDFFFTEIKITLARGEDVQLYGFGHFKLKDKSERPGRNPKTGKIISIAARRVVIFKPGQKLKDSIVYYDIKNNYLK